MVSSTPLSLLVTVRTVDGKETLHRYPLDAATEQERADLVQQERERLITEFGSELVSLSYPETFYPTAHIVAVRLGVGGPDTGANAPPSAPNPPPIGLVRNR